MLTEILKRLYLRVGYSGWFRLASSALMATSCTIRNRQYSAVRHKPLHRVEGGIGAMGSQAAYGSTLDSLARTD